MPAAATAVMAAAIVQQYAAAGGQGQDQREHQGECGHHRSHLRALRKLPSLSIFDHVTWD
jgi:hypothetical protein